MKAIALTWALVVVVLRLALVVNVLLRPGWLPIFFGTSEFLALCTTVYALSFGIVDLSLAGMVVPFLYATPLLFDVSSPNGPEWAAGIYLLLAPIQWVLRLRLGVRCTVSAPVLISIVDRFPYSFIRHPLGGLEIVLCSFIALWGWSPYNAFVWMAVVGSAVGCMLLEEKFLINEPSYREYCTRVRWRLIPGAW